MCAPSKCSTGFPRGKEKEGKINGNIPIKGILEVKYRLGQKQHGRCKRLNWVVENHSFPILKMKRLSTTSSEEEKKTVFLCPQESLGSE